MPVLEAAAAGLASELNLSRTESDRLFAILKSEALYKRPISLRHRVVFYVGHLDAFDFIQICRQGLGMKSLDRGLEDLFQAGIDPDSSEQPSDQPSDWPTLEQLSDYVSRCRRAVDDAIDHAPADALFMSLEHRLMHLETLAYMFHNYEYQLKNKLPTSVPRSNQKIVNSWREIPEGEAVLGRPNDGASGWDNEFGEVRKNVPGFRIQRYNVTNGDYLKFVHEGAALPHFWVERNGKLYYRGMFEEIPLPLDWPVYVTKLEAEAYAKWIGKTLPGEEQFHRAAYGTPGGGTREFPWGDRPPRHEHGNFDFKRWDPEPVDANHLGDSAFGVSQLVGNGWEWTNTLFAPFPGFEAHPNYPGYSANFFDGKHYVIKGGSPRTGARLLRRSFRNWFRPDYPYVYATFRCVEN